MKTVTTIVTAGILSWGLMMRAALPQEVDQASFQKSVALFDQGVKAAKNNNLDEAEGLFKQALEVNPLLPGAYIELGNVHTVKHDFKGALEFYLKAKDTFIQIYAFKAKNQVQQQNEKLDHIQAGQDSPLLQGALSSIGTDPIPTVQVSREKQMAEQRQVVTDVREADIPAQLFLLIGATRLRLGQTDLAEQDFQSGLKKDSKNALLHYNMGVVHFIKGRYLQAADEVRQAKKLGFIPSPDFVKQLETKGQLKL